MITSLNYCFGRLKAALILTELDFTHSTGRHSTACAMRGTLALYAALQVLGDQQQRHGQSKTQMNDADDAGHGPHLALNGVALKG